jgi:hypothetical protein
MFAPEIFPDQSQLKSERQTADQLRGSGHSSTGKKGDSIMREWFEIFKTGAHTDSGGNTKEWTEADLDAIAAGYDPAVYEAPIVIGHPELNAPAYGWIESLKRAGDKLLAKAKQVAPEFAELVRQGSYKKISVALTQDNKLRHVGFLGAAAPAVTGLKNAEFSSTPEAYCYEFAETDLPLFPGEFQAPVKQLQEALERLQQLEDKLHSLADAAKQNPDAKAIENQAALSRFCAFTEQKTATGFLTPAQKEILINLVRTPDQNNGQQSFSGDALSLLTHFVELLPRQMSAQRFANTAHGKPPVVSGAIEQLRKIFASQTGVV